MIRHKKNFIINHSKKLKECKSTAKLSFIQNAKILRNLKKKYPIFYISKIENFMGYEKRIEIIKNSDAIMIDRGDLAAEVGLNKLSIYIDNIFERM